MRTSNIKKNIISIYILFLLITINFIGFLVFDRMTKNIGVEAATIIVDYKGGGDYTSIQEAVDNASPGDTVRVWAGTYYENIQITKSISIIGNGSKYTTVNASGSGSNFYVTANWVNISGFNITDAGPEVVSAGIEFSKNNNCIISNNNFYKFIWYGINVYSANNITFVNNTFSKTLFHCIFLQNSSRCQIINNTLMNIGSHGVEISTTTNCIIANNKFLKNCVLNTRGSYNIVANNICKNDVIFDISGHNNTVYGNIFNNSSMQLNSANNCKVYNNIFTNNSLGFWISESYDNIITKNYFEKCEGIELILSFSNEIFNNEFNSCNYGFHLRYSYSNYMHNNTMKLCGIIVTGDLLKYWNEHIIDITNTVNSKPVYYWKDKANKTIPSGAGEVILANCKNIVIVNQNLSYGSAGILLGFSSYSSIINTICNSNFYYEVYLNNSKNNSFFNLTCKKDDRGRFGVYLQSSSFNIFDNSSFSNNPSFDFIFEYECKDNYAINCTFNTIKFIDSTSRLLAYNYLHIQVNNQKNKPIKGADIIVKCDEKTIYSTEGFNGRDIKTNSYGQVKWILVPYKDYNGDLSITEHKTKVKVKYINSEAINNNRIINMSISHFELFKIYVNSLPSKIDLIAPDNNIYINDSTPEFSWKAGVDSDNDPLFYIIQIDKLKSNWEDLIINYNTKKGILNWDISFPLKDGCYQWRVCANDGFGNGSWSDVWKFTIDTKPPTSTIMFPINNKFYNNLDIIHGFAYDALNGSGVKKVEICIRKLSDDFYWDGSTWIPIEFWLPVSGTNIWSYDSSSVKWITDTYYNIRSRAIDNVSNREISGSGVTFLYDDKPPDLSIFINNDEIYTNSTSVILSLFAEDSGSGLSYISFSTDNITWTDWEEHTILKQYNLSDNDGEKFVYFRVSDKANNTAIAYDNIILDTAPPYALNITINNGALEINSTQLILDLYAIDNLSGVDKMSFSMDGTNWSVWEKYIKIKMYNLSGNDGKQIIYFKVKDRVGNIANPVSASIILNTTSPMIDKIPKNNEPPGKSSTNKIYLIFIIIIIITIILIFLFIFLLNMKQKKNDGKKDKKINGEQNVQQLSCQNHFKTNNRNLFKENKI